MHRSTDADVNLKKEVQDTQYGVRLLGIFMTCQKAEILDDDGDTDKKCTVNSWLSY